MRYPLRHGATCWSFRASAVLSQRQRPPRPADYNCSYLRRRSPATVPKTPSECNGSRPRPGGARPPGSRRCQRIVRAQPGPSSYAGRARPSRAPCLPFTPPTSCVPRPLRSGRGRGACRPRLAVCAGPVTPGTSVAPASGGSQPPGAARRRQRAVSGPGSSPLPTRPEQRAREGRGDVCVRACACLSARGFGATGLGLHFAPHRPRAEFLRYPGSGGLRGTTRPGPRHPPGSLSATPPPLRRSRRCPRAPHERPSGRPPEADGARGCTQVRAGREREPRLQGARPSAIGGVSPGAAASAGSPAPLCSEDSRASP